jgi:hypothetical protein
MEKFFKQFARAAFRRDRSTAAGVAKRRTFIRHRQHQRRVTRLVADLFSSILIERHPVAEAIRREFTCKGDSRHIEEIADRVFILRPDQSPEPRQSTLPLLALRRNQRGTQSFQQLCRLLRRRSLFQDKSIRVHGIVRRVEWPPRSRRLEKSESPRPVDSLPVTSRTPLEFAARCSQGEAGLCSASRCCRLCDR